ncbi:hypothetical protein L218DRAFT_965678 [Marasmius fiardii PR-910]|nr:hypothetical protein L218DRAFT_965678 [Marasmius fiardii PR-910]
MTRSSISQYHPKLAKKALRAAAKDAGMRYVDAIKARNEAVKSDGKTLSTNKIGVVRRNPGRMDGVQWNGDSFICPWNVDRRYDGSGDDFDLGDGDDSDWEESEYPEKAPNVNGNPVTTTVSLMDIAKPMKVKGIAKDFEVVQTVRRVIVLDEDDMKSESGWEVASCVESEWDQIYEDDGVSDARGLPLSYSDAIRAKEKEDT